MKTSLAAFVVILCSTTLMAQTKEVAPVLESPVAMEESAILSSDAVNSTSMDEPSIELSYEDTAVASYNTKAYSASQSVKKTSTLAAELKSKKESEMASAQRAEISEAVQKRMQQFKDSKKTLQEKRKTTQEALKAYKNVPLDANGNPISSNTSKQ